MSWYNSIISRGLPHTPRGGELSLQMVFSRVMNLSATLLPAGPLTVIFVLAWLNNNRWERRGHKTGLARSCSWAAAPGMRRHCVRAEKPALFTRDEFGSHRLWIQKYPDVSWHAALSIRHITFLMVTRQFLWISLSSHQRGKTSKKKLVYQYLLHNFQPDWLLFKLDHFPLYNNGNSELQKKQCSRYWCFTKLIHLLVLVCPASSSCYNKK